MELRTRRRAWVAGLAVTFGVLLLAPSALAAVSLGSRTLREGMRGSDVLTLQKLLNKIGIAAPITGSFDAKTETLVLSFENKYGLVTNGTFTPADVNELRRVVNLESPTGGVSTGALTPSSVSSSSTYSSSGPPALKTGATGRWVAVLQQDLTYAGYSTQVDGQWGPATTKSVNTFKMAHRLALNGAFGHQAWSVLQTAVKAVESSVPAPAPGTALLNPNGTVTAPSNAPPVVQQMIAAANQIAFLPYVYGGGHASFTDTGYDCSGSVSYALHAAALLSAPEDSGELESFGASGPGQWVTIYANAGHVYMEIAGLWFDTAAQSSSNGQDRWSASRISPTTGYVERHIPGY